MPRWPSIAVAFFATLLVVVPARACEVGLVLGGGGARGGAHIGVLRALEAANVPVDCVAGTSIGAIVAALYATGMRPDEIEAFAASVAWDEAFSDRIPRPAISFRRKTDDELSLLHPGVGYSDGRFKLRGGVITGNNIGMVLVRIAARAPGERDFSRLPIPLAVVATDIATGEAVVLRGGDLAQALRASMSVPGVFSPVEIDGRLLVDGGVANNLPVDVVRALGAKRVIAVDVSEPLLARDAIRSAVDVTEQLTNILTRRNTDEQLARLGDADVLIAPDLTGFGNTEFSRMTEMVEIGETAVHAASARLVPLGRDPALLAAQLAARRAPAPTPTIAFHALRNHSGITNTVLRRQMRLDELVGQPLVPEVVQPHLAAAYGSELFETLRYEIVTRDGEHGIEVHVDERAWGPDYINLRLLAEGDLAGAAEVSIGLDYQRTNYSRNGGEWRTYLQLGEQRLIFTELFQPIVDPLGLGERLRDGWFVQPRLLYSNRRQGLFDSGGDKVAEIDLAEMHAELRMGYDFGTTARFEVGVRGGQFEAHARIGSDLPRADDRNIGEWFATFTWDDIDDRFFPSTGTRVVLQGLSGRGLFGADEQFDQVSADALTATDFAGMRLVARGSYERTLRGIAPLHRRPRLGGAFRLSGVSANELSGQQALLLGVDLYAPLGTPILDTYAGVSIGYGDVSDDEHFDWDGLRFSGNVWAGADLPLGPLYLGYGITEDGGDVFFISLGRPL